MTTDKFKTYKNLSGNSGVVKYKIGDDYIEIVFKKLDYIYRYSHKRPGQDHVDEMIELARSGEGLATYINIGIRENYESKRRYKGE